MAVSIALNVPRFFRITITNSSDADDTQPNATSMPSHRASFEYTSLGQDFYFKVPSSTARRHMNQFSGPHVAYLEPRKRGATINVGRRRGVEGQNSSVRPFVRRALSQRLSDAPLAVSTLE